jgi:hypothetical protein
MEFITKIYLMGTRVIITGRMLAYNTCNTLGFIPSTTKTKTKKQGLMFWRLEDGEFKATHHVLHSKTLRIPSWG